jgi:hypothetical protein
MNPSAATTKPVAERQARARAAARWIEFDEIDADATDEQALVRLIETQGAIAADTWVFDAD